jgi:hypothetical protein
MTPFLFVTRDQYGNPLHELSSMLGYGRGNLWVNIDEQKLAVGIRANCEDKNSNKAHVMDFNELFVLMGSSNTKNAVVRLKTAYEKLCQATTNKPAREFYQALEDCLTKLKNINELWQATLSKPLPEYLQNMQQFLASYQPGMLNSLGTIVQGDKELFAQRQHADDNLRMRIQLEDTNLSPWLYLKQVIATPAFAQYVEQLLTQANANTETLPPFFIGVGSIASTMGSSHDTNSIIDVNTLSAPNNQKEELTSLFLQQDYVQLATEEFKLSGTNFKPAAVVIGPEHSANIAFSDQDHHVRVFKCELDPKWVEKNITVGGNADIEALLKETINAQACWSEIDSDTIEGKTIITSIKFIVIDTLSQMETIKTEIENNQPALPAAGALRLYTIAANSIEGNIPGNENRALNKSIL